MTQLTPTWLLNGEFYLIGTIIQIFNLVTTREVILLSWLHLQLQVCLSLFASLCPPHPQKTEFYSSYPVYHSVYETFEIVQNFYDPSFERLRAVAQVRGALVFLLADSLVLPLDANEYATALGKYAHSIAQVAQRHPVEMKKYQVSFGKIIPLLAS